MMNSLCFFEENRILIFVFVLLDIIISTEFFQLIFVFGVEFIAVSFLAIFSFYFIF